MELLLNYLLKSGLSLLVLYLFYFTVLRKQPNFLFNRLYLLAATPLSLAIPLLKWPMALSTETAVGYTLRVVQLPEIVVVTAGQNTTDSFYFIGQTLEHLLFSMYALVASVLLGKLLQQLWKIQKLRVSATTIQIPEPGITVFQVPGQLASFAFLHQIFIGKQYHLTEAEQQQVLAHEMAHVQLKHTLDILYFEMLTAALWFNPVVWLLKNELRDVHEYQADARVLAKCQVSQYSSLLAKEVLYTSGMPIGSYFREPQILKRLQMMNQNNKHMGWLRPALLLLVLLGMAFAFSSQQVVSAEKRLSTSESANQTSEARMPILKRYNVETKAIPEQNLEKPYTYVEQMPQFEGGDLALQKFISKNITYPASAREAGKQGLIFIAFTVTKEGKLTDFELQKGLDEALDAEAMRILKLTADKWVPGKQNGKAVPVRYTIPVRFSLN